MKVLLPGRFLLQLSRAAVSFSGGGGGGRHLPAGEGDPAVAAARFGTPGQALLLHFGQVGGGVGRLGRQSHPVGLLVVLQRVPPAL